MSRLTPTLLAMMSMAGPIPFPRLPVPREPKPTEPLLMDDESFRRFRAAQDKRERRRQQRLARGGR